MKFVQKGTYVVVDKGVTDDADLLQRLVVELRAQGYNFRTKYRRRWWLLPTVTLRFDTHVEAQRAEHWIDNHFEA